MSSWFPPPRLRAVAFAVATSVLLAAAFGFLVTSTVPAALANATEGTATTGRRRERTTAETSDDAVSLDKLMSDSVPGPRSTASDAPTTTSSTTTTTTESER